MLSEKPILVTGAAGFIGSHLTEALLRQGMRVRAFVRYNSASSRGNLDHLDKALSSGLEIFAGDIRDPFGVKTAMTGCDTVFHLAAIISVPFSYHSPESYVATNISGTLNVLQAARELEVERLVHTSTSECYGTAQEVPIPETHPLNAQSPYAASKTGGDQMALAYHKSFGLPVSVIRPFNTYGPRQSARAVIPTIITQVAAGMRTVRLGALSPTRDFCFVEDTVAGFIAVASNPASRGRVFNVGSGFEISIGDTAKLIGETLGADLRVETDETRLRPENSEVERLCADIRLAWEVLGWKPRFSGREGLTEGVRRTAAWFADERNLSGCRPGTHLI